MAEASPEKNESLEKLHIKPALPSAKMAKLATKITKTCSSSASTAWVDLPHVCVGGQPVAVASCADLAHAMVADCLNARASNYSHPPRLVFDINGHGLSLKHTDNEYQHALAQADVVHADGGVIVTFSRWRCERKIRERSATTDLIHDFARAAQHAGLTFFLLGGTEAVNAAACARLTQMYPHLKIAGRRNGYFSQAQVADVLEEINNTKPDILWVGLGKPKEQTFSCENAGRIKAGWVVTCGGCYNYITGGYSRAPQWMQKLNIEWIHRMFTNPRQLLWRYITTTPHALWILISYLARGKTS